MRTLVLMPTYNEAKSIRHTLEHLLDTVPGVDVLVIDDGSPDGTANIVREISEENQRVAILERREKAGLGAAYIAGFQVGLEQGYELLVEMDADGSHRSEDLPALLKAAEEFDLVIGSRWIPGGAVSNWAWYRQALSQVGNRYASYMLKLKLADVTSGFRVFRSSLLRKLPLEKVQAQGYGFQIEMAYRSVKTGASVTQVPILFIEREWGESKMSFGIVAEALWLVTKWGLFPKLVTG